MVKSENETKPTSSISSEEAPTSDNKQKNQGKKRKRCSSESSNEDEIILPDNALEMERNVHASAVKNNLNETGVRKIIKKVITNDHVLALVQLKEEEDDSSSNEKNVQPKLTRAKVKELKKVSPQLAWNNLELTPIKHIPVKTRPEVKALIAQELPEDEDDEEYEPTNDDVPSDDDHIESCSDLDSQPRTPATPASQHAESPRVVKDGPFKVPQDVYSARRKLQIEEEAATIALRTRSKLSLSSTSIEHIESTFVPPDDLPVPAVDDLWNQFLNECLNPASTSKNEDDDETDPEYNAAADADAHDEDEESLGRSLIKISKKELNDLVTELFNIIPEATETDITQNMSNSVLTDNSHCETTQVAMKEEPPSEDEIEEYPSKRLTFEKIEFRGKNESHLFQEHRGNNMEETKKRNVQSGKENAETQGDSYYEPRNIAVKPAPRLKISTNNKNIEISIEESDTVTPTSMLEAPLSLRNRIKPALETVCIEVDSAAVTMTPEQVLIIQQQFRQHVQLAASNFLQVFVHPIHWKKAGTYKDFLLALTQIVDKNENSIANVCNLRPAMELITTWELSVSADTEENRQMIEYIQSQVTRSRRRTASNCLYAGEFHETFMKVISNSSVFLYPYLLPSMPYRPDAIRRFSYLHSEDTLIVLGLDQFWDYVIKNPKLFKLRSAHPRVRVGLTFTLELVAKHMFPWMNPRTLTGRVQAARKQADPQNAIHRYFKFNETPKIEHKILPYNPSITLYEQPEFEVPKIWIRYLAKTSKRFRDYYNKRSNVTGRQPDGVPIKPGIAPDSTVRKPLPIDFTKEIISHRATLHEKPKKTELTNRLDLNINDKANTTQNPTPPAQNFYKLVETSTGAYLVPLEVTTQTVNSNTGPITTPNEITTIVANHLPESRPKMVVYKAHCSCCVLLRKICKVKQTTITDYFRSKNVVKKCDCIDIKYPNVSNRLRLLVRHHKKTSELVHKELENILKREGKSEKTEIQNCDTKDIMDVLSYEMKVFSQASMCKRIYVKKRVHTLLSRFDVETGDPIALATSLFKAFDVELVHLYLDFLTFLTPAQADKMGMFKDYFTRKCSRDIMEKVMMQVQDQKARKVMLCQLKRVFTDNKSTACEICTGLLKTMTGYPTLARYTFGLFPHRKENRQVCETFESVRCTDEQVESVSRTDEQMENETCIDERMENKTYADEQMESVTYFDKQNVEDANDTVNDEPHNQMDYEADHSSSGEDSELLSVVFEEPYVEENHDMDTVIKTEPLAEDELETTDIISRQDEETVAQEAEIDAQKEADEEAEVDASEEDADEKAVAVAPKEEPDEVEIEGAEADDYASKSIFITANNKSYQEMSEWIREEDKIVLEVLKEHLSPEERQGKTVLQILTLLDEKNIYELLSETLKDKTFLDIKERVLVLLTVVVLSVDNVCSK